MEIFGEEELSELLPIMPSGPHSERPLCQNCARIQRFHIIRVSLCAKADSPIATTRLGSPLHGNNRELADQTIQDLSSMSEPGGSRTKGANSPSAWDQL
jgi:hypothetical protein